MRIWKDSFRLTGYFLDWSIASRIIIAFVAGALFGAILMGYASKAGAQEWADFERDVTESLRLQGLKLYAESMDEFGYDSTLSYRYTTQRINIVVVGHHTQFPSKEMRDAGAYGYVNSAINTIFIVGRIHEKTNQIVVNEAVLGHELLHLLNHGSRFFCDPDILYPHLRKRRGIGLRPRTPTGLKIIR